MAYKNIISLFLLFFFASPKKNQILRLRSGSDPDKDYIPFSGLFPDEAFVLLYFNINKLQRHLFFLKIKHYLKIITPKKSPAKKSGAVVFVFTISYYFPPPPLLPRCGLVDGSIASFQIFI